jgi:hypothetical protein
MIGSSRRQAVETTRDLLECLRQFFPPQIKQIAMANPAARR